MKLIRKKIWQLDENLVTPQELFEKRRSFIKLGVASLVSSGAIVELLAKEGLTSNENLKLNTFEQITSHNNFYEFTTNQSKVKDMAHTLNTDNWKITIDGLVEKPFTIDLNELVKKFGTEERIYRFRCVEGWSMVVPWNGFSLSSLIKYAKPLSNAKYVRFETLYDEESFPDQKRGRFGVIDYPYVEGLRLDEAMNDLSFLATGLYGQTMPKQNGAPNAYVVKSMEIDSLVDVFIYTDSEDRLVATTLKPYVYLYEFASLEIVDTAKFGAFVDIGLPKHILVPKNKQKGSFSVGGYKVLQLQLDDRTNRLVASEKYELLKEVRDLEKNDEVEIILYSKTPLGYKVIVNNRYEGMIYHTEIFENLRIGDKKRAYIKNVRDDNKIDISLQKIGQKVSGDKVYDILVENGGKLDFTYKSEAEDIKEVFGISKKAFKASLTKLIEEGKIVLEDSCIRVK